MHQKPRHKQEDTCPAKTATCNKCKRRGHYSSQCFSKTVAATTEEDEAQQDEVILNPVNTESESKIAGEQIQDPTRASSLQRSPTPKQRV